MHNVSFSLFVGATLALAFLSHGADLLERLGLGKSKSSTPLAPAGTAGALSPDQMLGGLKEALAKGVQHAITNLGRSGGFRENPVARTTDLLRKVFGAVGE